MNSTSTYSSATATPTFTPPDSSSDAPHGPNAVVSFIIGSLIILAASMMNAAGLNITKLDHVRTASLPKSARRNQLLRPLWLLGMTLYILSQLLGSTLALQYLRAEYVAPLGSTSLIFNFLFASWLVSTPVTKTDIRGTIIVIIGVIGIVVFGSVHSSDLNTDIDLSRLQYFWSRAAWWGYFILMALSIAVAYIGSSTLETILEERAELEVPVTAPPPRRPKWMANRWLAWIGVVRERWITGRQWAKVKLEHLTEASDDKFLAWVLGIGWSCCGGALAGGCLIFAKVCVSLLSPTASRSVPFAYPVSILTLLLLAATAVFQIICLNRGLEAWDSTLVVPVFYAIYTCSGFLDSLIFYDETGYYQFWVLSCILLSIVVLIAGVILLSTKKPERARAAAVHGDGAPILHSRTQRSRVGDDNEESTALREGEGPGNGEVMWELGDASDEEDVAPVESSPKPTKHSRGNGSAEAARLVESETEGEESMRPVVPRTAVAATESVEDFGEFTSPWKG